MLAATIRVVQVMDMFEVRAVLTIFSPGMDPESFSSKPLLVSMSSEEAQADPLTITKRCLALWSEMTNPD